jgi:hypothetical protein
MLKKEEQRLIYEDIKDDIAHIIKLYTNMKAERLGIEEVIDLLKIANLDLRRVRRKYQRLKEELSILESSKLKETSTLRSLQIQIEDLKRILKLLRITCQDEESNISQLRSEKIKLKRIVKWFKYNDEEYLKIKKAVRDEVTNVLSDSRKLLRLAFYSLIEHL